MNTHGIAIDFGRHKGTLYTRVPVSYLKWMVREPGLPREKKNIAQAELDRRGTVTPTIEVTGHAIDRASLRLGKQFDARLDQDIGLYTWLEGKAKEAIEKGQEKGDKIIWDGITFIFDKEEGLWPVLKSVY